MLPEQVQADVAAWIKKAEGDFRAIELLLAADDAPLDVVCFHAQEGAEKYIKASLTALGIPFHRTHDLPELLLLVPDSSSAGEVGDLSDLTDAAVVSRYPGEAEEYDRATANALV